MTDDDRARYQRVANGLTKRRRMSRVGRLLERVGLRPRVIAAEDETLARAPLLIAVGLYPHNREQQLAVLDDIGSVRDKVRLLAEHAQLASHTMAGDGTDWLRVSMLAVDELWRAIMDLERHMGNQPEGVWQYIFTRLSPLATSLFQRAAAEGRTPEHEYGRQRGDA